MQCESDETGVFGDHLYVMPPNHQYRRPGLAVQFPPGLREATPRVAAENQLPEREEGASREHHQRKDRHSRRRDGFRTWARSERPPKRTHNSPRKRGQHCRVPPNRKHNGQNSCANTRTARTSLAAAIIGDNNRGAVLQAASNKEVP